MAIPLNEDQSKEVYDALVLVMQDLHYVNQKAIEAKRVESMEDIRIRSALATVSIVLSKLLGNISAPLVNGVSGL